MDQIGINRDDKLVSENRVSKIEGSQRNVLLVVRWPVGGIRTFLKYVISDFPAENYRFSIVGVSTEGMNALRSDLGNRVDTWVLVPPDGSEARGITKAIWKLCRSKHFDAIHAHGFTSAIASIPSCLVSRSALICTAHDTLSDVQFSGVGGKMRKVILATALWKCRAIHSVSKDAESNLLSYFPFLRGKSVAIKNGINVSLFRDCERANLHETLGIDPLVKIIGFFGRFMGPKGFKYLISAIELIKNESVSADVHVVCFGSGAFIREEQLEIERRGLVSFFTFLPFTADVSGAMKGCDLIVMPSISEACPLQPMEALCAGVPFVGTNCIGLREVLERTPALQVQAGDSNSLAEGILQSFKRGRDPFVEFAPIAAERFDVRNTIAEIYELYEKVIE